MNNFWKKVNPEIREYVDDILSGTDVAGEAIRLACQRFKDWVTTDKYIYNEDKVNKAIDFIEHLKHFEDSFAGKPFILFPWQKFIIANIFGFYKKEDPERRVTRNMLMLISRKNGKGLDLNTEIPTPSGFKRFGNLHTGDYIFGANGNPTKIVFETPIQNRNCYKVTFETGESIITDDVHNWLVKDVNNRTPDTLNVMTTEQMYKKGTYRVRLDGKGVEYRFRIPKQKPVQYSEKKLPMDPYSLGVWLGDGDSRGPRFGADIRDLEIYDHISKHYGEYEVRKDPRNNYGIDVGFNKTWYNYNTTQLTADLKKAGVYKNKHIPEIYKYSSIEQRLALIQGLMDTDGSISKRKYPSIEFTQKRKDIVEDVKEILASLGINSRMETEAGKINGIVVGEYYTLRFFADKTMPMFRLKRKYDRLSDNLNKRMNYTTIKSIEKVDSVPTKCIAVDNPEHLFLVGRGYHVTHNTTLAVAIALAVMVVDGTQGGEQFIMANTKEQGAITYKFVKGFVKGKGQVKGLDPKGKYFDVFRDRIYYKKLGSSLTVLSADAETQDGHNPSCFIIDEYHEAKDADGYNVLKSGQAARKNPLSIIISSAGFNLDGFPLYESIKVGYDVLRGIKQDDSTFYAIYLLDEGDDWTSQDVWKKACPNYGITVDEEFMKERVLEALNDLSKETDVKTKNFNIFCSSVQSWITNDVIVKSMHKVDLKDFMGQDCWMGVDLSESSDLTAVSLMLPPNSERKKWPDKYIFKTLIFIPPIAMKRSKNRSVYQGFLSNGYAHLTSGVTINYEDVIKSIQGVAEKLEIVKIGLDKWNGKNFQKMAEDEGFPIEAYSQSIQNFNIPTKTFTELMLNDLVILDKNTAVAWAFQNVEMRSDRAQNWKPDKAGDDKNRKIDPVIAMLQALGVYLSEENYYFG